MSLADTVRAKRSRPSAGADPAYAFGAEEQTMEEIRRQNFVPPAKKSPGVAARAGAALAGLRQKIAGESDPDFDGFDGYRESAPPAREAAPVYSAGTYDQPAAPDMGWENPFTSPSPAPARSAARTAQPRTAPAAAYPNSGYDDFYGQGGQAAPAYAQTPYYAAAPAGYDPYGAGAAPYGYGYDPFPPAAGYAPAPETYAQPREPVYAEPSMANPYADPVYYGADPYAQGLPPEGSGTWYGPDNMPRQPRRAAQRQRMKPGDFKYYFWSCSIVAGMLLTVAAFIYGCAV